MITELFAWFRSLFTRRTAPAAQPAPAPVAAEIAAYMRRLKRKNRNQATRIEHLAKWQAAHKERIDALLSEIHDLTAKLGEMTSENVGMDAENQAMSADYEDLKRDTLQLIAHIRQIAGVWECPDATGRTLAQAVNEAVHAADLADWTRPASPEQDRADFDAFLNSGEPQPAPKLDDPDTWTPAQVEEYNHAEAERIERLLADQQGEIHMLAEHIRTVHGIFYDSSTDTTAFIDAVRAALAAADLADWEHAADYDGAPFPPIPPDPTDPVRDRDLTLTAPSMVGPDVTDWGANGTGEPDTARIEAWRPLPTPAPRPYHPGGIL